MTHVIIAVAPVAVYADPASAFAGRQSRIETRRRHTRGRAIDVTLAHGTAPDGAMGAVKLIEGARGDWAVLGMKRVLVTRLSHFPQGTSVGPVEGILFTACATLHRDDRSARVLPMRRIADGLGSDLNGVIVFDQARAMQDSAGREGERAEVAISLVGQTGLWLRAPPEAGFADVSVACATTVHILACAQQLGLGGGADSPFATRAQFFERGAR